MTTVGGSIAVIAIGAILTFAVTVEIAGLNLDAVGIILMLAGAVGVVIGAIRFLNYRASRGPAGPPAGPPL
ncbi:MAG: hypothetical protein GEU81_06450 [Nitriliruptorales bacterium]|nr:hypothetical protein [Nitriliruptorales bacterium]